jgi:uncharacterized protein
MLVILSPAKTLNMEAAFTSEYTTPIYCSEALEIMKELRNYTPPDMESIMKINRNLAEENFFRHLKWDIKHTLSNSKQALLAYHGAVFQGLSAADFCGEELHFAQRHIRILSGLYGVLRPLDLIQPYRLEMAIKLKNSSIDDLYSFWKEKLTTYFHKEIESHHGRTLINLASNEYYSVLDMKKLNCNIITPIFKEYKNGTYKNITIYAKRARGLMTRYIIKNAVTHPEDLKEFKDEGYYFNASLSTENQWVFTR